MKKIKIREAARKENLLMEFYLSIPEMLQSLGILNYRESDIMQRLIKGDDISLVGEQYGLSSVGVRRVFIKGCKKARCLNRIKKQLDELKKLKLEMQIAKPVMKRMKAELDLLRPGDYIKQHGVKLKILCNNISDYGLSARAMMAMRVCNVDTIGDLCKLQKKDLLQVRNTGKKTIKELDDFLSNFGLSFGMDVDRLYQAGIEEQLLKDENENNNDWLID